MIIFSTNGLFCRKELTFSKFELFGKKEYIFSSKRNFVTDKEDISKSRRRNTTKSFRRLEKN